MTTMPKNLHFVASTPAGGREIRVFSIPRVQLGRDPSADLQVDDDAASRLHAVVLVDGERVAIADLGSANGTLVNGEELRAPRFLSPDDVVAIGRVQVSVSLVSSGMEESIDEGAPVAETPNLGPRARAKTAMLTGVDPRPEARLPLRQEPPEHDNQHTIEVSVSGLMPLSPQEAEEFFEQEATEAIEALPRATLEPSQTQPPEERTELDYDIDAEEISRMGTETQGTIEVDAALFTDARAEMQKRAQSVAQAPVPPPAPEEDWSVVSALLKNDVKTLAEPRPEWVHVSRGSVVDFSMISKGSKRKLAESEAGAKAPWSLRASAKKDRLFVWVPKTFEGEVRAGDESRPLTERRDSRGKVELRAHEELVVRHKAHTHFFRFADRLKTPTKRDKAWASQKVFRISLVALSALAILVFGLSSYLQSQSDLSERELYKPQQGFTSVFVANKVKKKADEGWQRPALHAFQLDAGAGFWSPPKFLGEESVTYFDKRAQVVFVPTMTSFEGAGPDQTQKLIRLRETLQGSTTALNDCFANDISAFNKHTMQWSIDSQGLATDLDETGPFAECLRTALKSLRFPVVDAERVKVSALWFSMPIDGTSAKNLEEWALESKNDELWRYSALLYDALKLSDDAKAAIETARALAPTSFKNARAASAIAARAGRVSDADDIASLLAKGRQQTTEALYDTLVHSRALYQEERTASARRRLVAESRNASEKLRLAQTLASISALDDALLVYESARPFTRASDALAYATLLHRRGRDDELRAFVDKATPRFLSNAGLSMLAGVMGLLEGRFEDALSSVDRVIALEPSLALAHSLRGIALAQLTQYNSAADAFDKAIALSPKVAAFHYNRGLVSLARTATKDALSDLESAMAISPSHEPARTLLGELYLSRGRVEDWRALTQSPNPLDAQRSLALAQQWLVRQSPTKATKGFMQAFAKDPSAPQALALVQRSGLSSNAPLNAQWVIRATLETQSKRDLTWHETRALALAYLQSNDSEAYQALKNRVLAMDVSDEDADLAYLALLDEFGAHSKAQTLWVRLQQARPDDVAIRSYALEDAPFGDRATGIEKELRGLMGKGNMRAQVALAAHLSRTKRSERALTLAKQAEFDAPLNVETFELLGTLHLKKNDYPSARSAFEQAVSISPTSSIARRGLAQLADIEGDNELARANREVAEAVLTLNEISKRIQR